MDRQDGVGVRRERIQAVVKRVLAWLPGKNEIRLSKTLAFLEYETGITRERLMHYLKVGEETEHFIIDEENDRIKPVKTREDN